MPGGCHGPNPLIICTTSIDRFPGWQVITALDSAERASKPPVSDLITDVYDTPPWNLREQLKEVMDHLNRHPHELPAGVPLK